MTSVDMIKSLYAYNKWANQRILDTAQQLTQEQFLADVGASFPSARDTLAHTMLVQYNWLHRFQKMPLPPQKEFSDFPDLSSIITTWEQVNAETDLYIATIPNELLSEIITYINSRGIECSYARWQIMVHQVNHATQHRSEAAVMLTQFGYSPGNLDYLIYVDQVES